MHCTALHTHTHTLTTAAAAPAPLSSPPLLHLSPLASPLLLLSALRSPVAVPWSLAGLLRALMGCVMGRVMVVVVLDLSRENQGRPLSSQIRKEWQFW